MKSSPLLSRLFVLALVLSSCARNAHTAPSSIDSRTPVLTPKIELIPVVIGETPANDANAIAGIWQLENFTVTSKGQIAGRLTVDLSRQIGFPLQYQDVLIIQVWAIYVWPQGDMLSKPAGEFIPVKAASSTEMSATFQIDGNFDIPSEMLEGDGGMPFDHFQIMMIWYRLSYISENGWGAFQAKIGTPEMGDPPWLGIPLLDRIVSLSGTIDTNVRGGLDYSEWLRANVDLPTRPLVSYPVSEDTPMPIPLPAYPLPSDGYP